MPWYCTGVQQQSGAVGMGRREGDSFQTSQLDHPWQMSLANHNPVHEPWLLSHACTRKLPCTSASPQCVPGLGPNRLPSLPSGAGVRKGRKLNLNAQQRQPQTGHPVTKGGRAEGPCRRVGGRAGEGGAEAAKRREVTSTHAGHRLEAVPGTRTHVDAGVLEHPQPPAFLLPPNSLPGGNADPPFLPLPHLLAVRLQASPHPGAKLQGGGGGSKSFENKKKAV